MASNPFFKVCFETSKTQSQKDQELQSYHRNKAQISTFPVELRWGHPQRNYQSFWLPESILSGVLSLQQNFKPTNNNIFLVTYPKSGTTWLKALTFTIVNRFKTTFTDHPLLSRHPYDCAPYLESIFSTPSVPDIDVLPSPRPLATHIPYSILTDSIKNSDSRIVYLSRNPKDALVSMWHFLAGASPTGTKPVALETMFDLLCNGVSPYGPVWDHQLEYWKQSLERPENVLFLRYEELREKPEENVRRLAEFVGMPFSEEEEKGGVVEEVVRLCSFENLKGLNENGVRLDFHVPIKNSLYFRKGVVGDWKEHLSEEMGDRIDRILEEKLKGSGLSFK